MKNYRKFLVALSGVLVAVGVVIEDGDVSGDEALTVGGALVIAVGVFFARNTPPGA
jgi:hypothetical protein